MPKPLPPPGAALPPELCWEAWNSVSWASQPTGGTPGSGLALDLGTWERLVHRALAEPPTQGRGVSPRGHRVSAWGVIGTA